MDDFKNEFTNKLKRPSKYDVDVSIPFYCLIGKTKVTLSVLVEPDPHGDGKGTDAHFHTAVLCPYIKVVEIPELDRCRITDETCPFVTPLGSRLRSPEQRKSFYAHEIIRYAAFIEFYGTQLVNEKIFKPLGLKGVGNLRLVELNRILLASKLIDKKMYKRLEKIRSVRNKLAHEPNAFLRFSERELFKLTREALKAVTELSKFL